MSPPHPSDTALAEPADVVLTSARPGVTYTLGRRLGDGGMAIAYEARRDGPEGDADVVVKVWRAELVSASLATAALAFQKEVVALGRLAEQVPSTPFVVQMLDAGLHTVRWHAGDVELPWVAMEYVHGGSEGATLTERISRALKADRRAFGRERAARAIDCVARGLAGAHALGIVHRDVKPDNVLACGVGDGEIFKVADFGIAHVGGVAETFGAVLIGTPGYIAPERFSSEPLGPWTDIFSLGALAYALLTGEVLFDARSIPGALQLAMAPARRSITASRWIADELRADVASCQAIDAAIARATAPRPSDRPSDAVAFATEMLAALAPRSRRITMMSTRRVDVVDTDVADAAWTWRVHGKPWSGRDLQATAWDGDARCLALTSKQPLFWDGAAWRVVRLPGAVAAAQLAAVARLGPGVWAMAPPAGPIAIVGQTQEPYFWALPPGVRSLVHLDGDEDGMALLVGIDDAGGCSAWTRSEGAWGAPVALPGLARANAVARTAARSWLVGGRGAEGRAWLARVDAGDARCARLDLPMGRSILACRAEPVGDAVVAVGTDGLALRYADGALTPLVEPSSVTFTAVDTDAAGRVWATTTAAVVRLTTGRAPTTVWTARPGADLGAPLVTLFADVGRVLTVSAAGHVVDGRLDVKV